jgi:hypothetical protein
MIQNQIKDLPSLKNDDYANIFNVHTDDNGFYYYNILQGVNIPANLPDGYYTPYSVIYGDTWPFISYKKYRTPNLWWLITTVNNIQDPTKQPNPGTEIKILKTQYATLVINEISTSKK